jgi:hypothetical protein
MRPKTFAATSAVLVAFALAGGPASALAAPKLDKTTPNLMKYCAEGTHIKRAVVF